MYLKLIFIMSMNLFLTKKKQSLIYICKMLQIFQITSVSNCWNECHQLLLRLSCHEPALLMFHSKYKIWWSNVEQSHSLVTGHTHLALVTMIGVRRHHWSAVERRPDPLMTSVQVYSQQYFQTLCWWITLHIQMYSSQQEVSNIIGDIDAGPSTSLYHLPLANWSLCTQTNIAFPNQNMIRIFTSQ